MNRKHTYLFAAIAAALVPSLTAAEKTDEIEKVKAIFTEVNSSKLTAESFEYNDPPTGSSGEIVQYKKPDTSNIRKLKVIVAVDDGGSTAAEFYIDTDGAPRFVFVNSEGVEYGDDGNPFLVATQLRLYFDGERKLLRSLSKKAQAQTQKEIADALKNGVNQELSVAPIPATRILNCVEELSRSLNTDRARDISQTTMAAIQLSDEPEPPADKQQWISVSLEEDKTYPSEKFTHEIFNDIIATTKLPHPEADAPAIHLFHTHRYPGDFSVTTLATTDRLFHDSIDSIRYRMDIRESPEDKIHVSFFGYQIRPRSESSRKGTAKGWVAESFKSTPVAE